MQAIHSEVVQRDAAGRRELDELHRQSHAAVATRIQAVDQQRDLLEQERREIAEARQRAPVVAEAVRFVGGLIVCLTPLLVVLYLLRTLSMTDNTDGAVLEVLVEELMADRPRLLPSAGRSPALPDRSAESSDTSDES